MIPFLPFLVLACRPPAPAVTTIAVCDPSGPTPCTAARLASVLSEDLERLARSRTGEIHVIVTSDSYKNTHVSVFEAPTELGGGHQRHRREEWILSCVNTIRMLPLSGIDPKANHSDLIAALQVAARVAQLDSASDRVELLLITDGRLVVNGHFNAEVDPPDPEAVWRYVQEHGGLDLAGVESAKWWGPTNGSIDGAPLWTAAKDLKLDKMFRGTIDRAGISDLQVVNNPIQAGEATLDPKGTP